MDSVNVTCPHCAKINRIPKKDSYAKANCGHCKGSLLDTKPIEVTASNFSQYVGGSGLPVVVDFWAPWCGPCKMMAPAFAEASIKLTLKAQFLKVNTETEQTLGVKYAIRSIPTMILFRDGVEVDRVSGAMSSEQILQWIRSKM